MPDEIGAEELQEKKALLDMMLNGEYTLLWTWEEWGKIGDNVKPLHLDSVL